jgi:hypothetical protein
MGEPGVPAEAERAVDQDLVASDGDVGARESSRRPSRLASLRTTRHARLSTVIRPLRRKRAAVGSSDVSALARSAGDACSASSDRCRSRTRAGASLIRVETAAVPGAGKEAARKRKRAVFPLAETMIEEAVNGRQRGAGFDGWRHLGVIDKAANRVIPDARPTRNSRSAVAVRRCGTLRSKWRLVVLSLPAGRHARTPCRQGQGGRRRRRTRRCRCRWRRYKPRRRAHCGQPVPR